MSIQMPYFNLLLYVSSPRSHESLPPRESLNWISHFQRRLVCTKVNVFFYVRDCLSSSPSGDGASGSAFWRNLNGVSLPIGRYPVIVGIIDGVDLATFARQNI